MPATAPPRSSPLSLTRRSSDLAGLVVAGMGGSAVGGSLARAILGDHAVRPILAARSYGLPAWTTPDTTVLCSDRKSTRLNSSHVSISYAVFCLKKKKRTIYTRV